MKCPACGVKAGNVQCHACGLVFDTTPAPVRNPWIGRGLAVAVVVGWLLLLWFTSRR